jgi:flagellar biosynthetic protein FliS
LELVGALDENANKEITESLQSLYDYFLWQISQSVTEKKTEPLDDVSEHATGLRQAWGQAVQENRANQPNSQAGQSTNLRSQIGTIKA